MANIKQKYNVRLKVTKDGEEKTDTYFKFNQFEEGGIGVAMTIEQAKAIGKLGELAEQGCCQVNESKYGKYIAFKVYTQEPYRGENSVNTSTKNETLSHVNLSEIPF